MPMQQVTSTRTWGTRKRSCSGSVTSAPSGLFTIERRSLQITTKQTSISSYREQLTIKTRTSTGFTSTARQITIRGIPLLVLPQYPSCTSIQNTEYLKFMMAQTSGLTCGIVPKAQTTSSLPTTALRVVPSVSRATVIWTNQSGWWCDRNKLKLKTNRRRCQVSVRCWVTM